jgi:hypothetical protein
MDHGFKCSEDRTQCSGAASSRPAWSAMPARTLGPVAQDTTPTVEGLPAADDEFWDRVRQAATGLPADAYYGLLEDAETEIHQIDDALFSEPFSSS